jgi:hypothetical protein
MHTHPKARRIEYRPLETLIRYAGYPSNPSNAQIATAESQFANPLLKLEAPRSAD